MGNIKSCTSNEGAKNKIKEKIIFYLDFDHLIPAQTPAIPQRGLQISNKFDFDVLRKANKQL